jgi:mxaL protein
VKWIELRRHVHNFGAARLGLVMTTVLLGLALLGPQVRVQRAVFHYVFVVDISQSMNTMDYAGDGRRISRLAMAKAAVKDALAALPCGSKAGLGVFIEHRSMLLLTPVDTCASYAELTDTLERVDWRMGWAGASEVAKGLYSAIRLLGSFDPKPTLVFLTDGHEAPPLHPRHRPMFNGTPGEIQGLVVGTGGFALMPIPKFDMGGNALGYWLAEEVMQTDVYSRGRSASVAQEPMVDSAGARVASPKRAGGEHLSSLKEDYLRELVRTAGLGYRRLTDPAALSDALSNRAFARLAPVTTDLGPAFGVLALLCLTGVYGAGMFARIAGITRSVLRRGFSAWPVWRALRHQKLETGTRPH